MKKLTPKEEIDTRVDYDVEQIFVHLAEILELGYGDIEPNQLVRLNKLKADLSTLVYEWYDQNKA